MNTVLVGNIICFAASIIMTLMGLIKDKKRFLAAQCGMNGLFAVGNYVLGGISGSIVNLVTMIRNIYCLKRKMGPWSRILFIAAQIGLTAAAGCKDVIMWLPVIANCVFTWFMFSEDMVLLKAIVVASQFLWAIFDYSISNFASVPFDIAAAVTNTISLIALLKDRSAGKQEENKKEA